MVSHSPALPNKQWLTLCEAVTWIAYGEALDKEQLFRLGFPSERKYRNAWLTELRRSQNEAPPGDPFANFLKAHCHNPFNTDDLGAINMTAEELVAVRAMWPSSGEALYTTCLNWEEARRIEQDRERSALNDIWEAAVAGEIKLRGRRNNGAGPERDYTDIDAAHLDDHRVLDWVLSMLSPRRTRPVEGTPDCCWNFEPKPEDKFECQDVLVERKSFEKWLIEKELGSRDLHAEKLALRPQPVRPVSFADLKETWAKHRPNVSGPITRHLIRNWGRNEYGDRASQTRLDELDKWDAQNHPRKVGRRRKVAQRL